MTTILFCQERKVLDMKETLLGREEKCPAEQRNAQYIRQMLSREEEAEKRKQLDRAAMCRSKEYYTCGPPCIVVQSPSDFRLQSFHGLLLATKIKVVIFTE